jgi:cell division FtsZ-interacting protein ZapD
MSGIENNIGNLLDVVQRETLRTRLLFALDEIYPKWARTDLLHSVDKEMPLKVIDRELAYLEEKGLVQREVPRAGNVLKNKITARGRDFLDGHISEVGLASPGMCREKS